ncbi:MAG: restriction endonuclease subunit S [Schaalia sp.]
MSEAGLQSIKGSILEGTSVLVGCIGWDIGNIAMTNDRCASNHQINAVTSIISEVNPEYLYYWLSMKKDYLFSIASMTRTPILSKSTFEQVKVPMPSQDVQDGIARILASIDDQIATNGQVNDNLSGLTTVA